jgi:hypothetical protein
MAKQQDYGFKTPRRRETKNITGFKVGGDLSGGECKILKSNQLLVEKSTKQRIKVDTVNAKALFGKNLVIFAMGGYFYSENAYTISFEIVRKEKSVKIEKYVEKGSFVKLGLDMEIPFSEIDKNSDFVEGFVEITCVEPIKLNYWIFKSDFITYDYFEENDVYAQFFNSKKEICYPEQFYGDENKVFENNVKGIPFVLKSCNRCQRFLPINHFNERIHLGFTNHCSTKAPCTHGNFANYKILETDLNQKELLDFIENDTVFNLQEDFVIAHFGHQLECKACKKFYVNSALNSKRSASQHREDGLRRRAFEVLVLRLLNQDWIYHKYRLSNKNKEFDTAIWEKFDKKCFKCKKDLPKLNDMDLDHTMPLAFLYNLDETATSLCGSCNSSKSDSFPVDFYSEDELLALEKLTNIPLDILKSRKPNQKVVDLLKANIVWFFEEFLTFEEFQKDRDGKKAVDSICHSLQKVINKSENPFDLNETYQKAISIQ